MATNTATIALQAKSAPARKGAPPRKYKFGSKRANTLVEAGRAAAGGAFHGGARKKRLRRKVSKGAARKIKAGLKVTFAEKHEVRVYQVQSEYSGSDPEGLEAAE